MCMMSLVMDQYRPFIPPSDYRWNPNVLPPGVNPPSVTPYILPTPIPAPISAEDLRRLLDAFKKACAAAEEFDEITGQPDCVDPEKAELIDRVAELEAQLDAIRDAAGA